VSVANLQLVTGMPLVPHACVLCGNNPVDENTGEQFEHVFAPGVDVDWGSSVYVCHECCEIISDLKGRSTRAGFDKLSEKYEVLKDAHEALKKEHEKAKALLTRIRDGKAAVKETRKEKVS